MFHELEIEGKKDERERETRDERKNQGTGFNVFWVSSDIEKI